MAKGFKKHQERIGALSALGRGLARRSRSKCETCASSGVPLEALEVAPLPEEPNLEACVFACAPCRSAALSGKIGDPQRWRCLEETVWAEVPAVQVVVVRLLRHLEANGEGWAGKILEDLYLDPEVEAWTQL